MHHDGGGALAQSPLATVFGNLEGVETLVDIDNTASQRLLEKARFQREAVLRSYRVCVVKGRLRTCLIYSFVSTDPLVD